MRGGEAGPVVRRARRLADNLVIRIDEAAGARYTVRRRTVRFPSITNGAVSGGTGQAAAKTTVWNEDYTERGTYAVVSRG